ncbi:MAG: hypothetical protein QXF26_03360 [Candidatus Bathyarchaeia archaeon]
MPRSYRELVDELKLLRAAEEEAKKILDDAEKEADDITRKAELEASRLYSENEAEYRKERLRVQENMEKALMVEMAKLMDAIVEQRKSLRDRARSKEAEAISYILNKILPKSEVG